jgi:DNA-binding NarL/FixJ family response regulator
VRGASAIEFPFDSAPDPGPPWISRFNAHTAVTERERDVLSVLLCGSTVPDGARRLGLATSTVRMHVKNLHSKSGTNNLHSLAVWALTHYDCCWSR